MTHHVAASCGTRSSSYDDLPKKELRNVRIKSPVGNVFKGNLRYKYLVAASVITIANVIAPDHSLADPVIGPCGSGSSQTISVPCSGGFTWLGGSLDVESGVSVESTSSAVTVNNGVSAGTLTNGGSLISSSSSHGALYLDGGSIEAIINSAGATISNDSQSAIDNSSATIGSIVNSGTLSAPKYVILNEQGEIESIVNTETGSLIGTADRGQGITNNGTVGTILNDGLIESINATPNDFPGSPEPNPSGIVNIGNAESITNNGTIRAGGSANGAGIVNSGQSVSGTWATIGTLTNTGLISVDSYAPGNTANPPYTVGIENTYGYIDSLDNQGDVVAAGYDGAASYGVENYGTVTEFSNSGSISATADTGLAYGILNRGAGSVRPVATISAFSNTGTINSDDYAIYNMGAIDEIDNSGTISGSVYGIYNTGIHASIGSIENSGSITGGEVAIDASSNIGTLYITNSGTISGPISLNVGASSVVLTAEAGSQMSGDIALAGGSLDVSVADEVTFSHAFTGDGEVKKTGEGTLTLAGLSSYTGSTLVSEGTLVASSASLGSGAIVNNASLLLRQSADGVLTSTITGTGTLTKQGAGKLTLAGDASAYAGISKISAGSILLTGSLGGNVVIYSGGTLQVGNGTNDGELTADTVNNGSLIFHQSGNYDYSGALSGNGGLVKRGEGRLLLSGDYSYTGSTVVEGGTIRLTTLLDRQSDLVIDNGTFDLGGKTQEVAGLSGSGGVLDLGTAGALTVSQGEDSSFNGAIAGSGHFIKTGAGSLNLTGISSFNGAVSIDQGRLAVNGVLPGQIAVKAGGVLGGNGTTGSVLAGSGGTVSPGNSIGTLHVNGDVSFAAGSTYLIELDSSGQNDLIEATGAADISGGTVSVVAEPGDYLRTTDYTILTAGGGVNGTFDGTDISLPFLTPTLHYNANDVLLTLDRNDVRFASIASTPNQLAVAAAIDATDINDPLYRALIVQTNEAGALRAFDALSGELWATAGTFVVDRARQAGALALDRLERADEIGAGSADGGRDVRESPGGGAAWVQAFGSWYRVDGDGNAAAAGQDQKGLTAGLDTLLGDWRVGMALSYGEGQINLDERASDATVSGSNAILYAGGGWGATRLRFGGSYGWLDVDGRREVIFPGVSETVSGQYDSTAATAFAEVNYAAKLGTFAFEPFAGVNYVHAKSDAFNETGSLVALGVDDLSRDVTFTNLGVRFGKELALSDTANVATHLSVAWQHALGDLEAFSQNRLPGGEAFSVAGLPVAQDVLRIEAGAHAMVGQNASLDVSYVGNIANDWNDHGVKAGFSLRF